MLALPRHPIVYELNAAVWLNEVSARAGRRTTLASVPDAEWQRLAALGVHAVWLMGVWERSPAGRAIALGDATLRESLERALPGFTARDVVGSPYCVRRYEVDPAFGGTAGLATARAQLARRGIALVLDFVPNHVAPDHPWIAEHPEGVVTGNEEDLARDPASFLRIGPHVVARGRDPYFAPWPDVVQLNAFAPATRAAFLETLRRIAQQCDAVRCDMAMLVTNEVFARTWGMRVGAPPPDDLWPGLIERVRAVAPGFTFIAEAYWDFESKLQQQGFDYCYDKRLYDRLRSGGGSVYEHLLAPREYQDRLVRFVENHDELRAAEAFGVARSCATASLILALPGAKLLHDGQFEGRTVRLPVFLQRAPAEPPNGEVRAFYERLLSDARVDVFRTGEWRLCERRGWPDNDSYRDIIACAWRTVTERRLVVVNLSGARSQAMVTIPWDDIAGCWWRLSDFLDGDVFLRNGDTLRAHGLYVDLPAWGVHWLSWGRQ